MTTKDGNDLSGEAVAARPALVIGLTGGIGSGKSTVGEAFERLGICVIDADAIAHAMTAPGGLGIGPIRREFGDAFIGADGAMDREGMRRLVFNEPSSRTRLEAILHPLIRAETGRRLALARSPYCILMIPLLVEAARTDPRWRERYDRIVVVDCSEATQVARVMGRNGFDESGVRRILSTQATRAERLAQADDVIDNDDGLEILAAQVLALHSRYLGIAKELRA